MSQTLAVCPRCQVLNRVRLEGGGKRPVCGKCATELAVHGAVSEASAAGLAKILEKSDRPVVVDFWAPWCGPCRTFAPTYSGVAAEMADRFVFLKVDTEAHPLAGERHRIRSIPTLAVFRGGVEVTRLSGALPAPQFRQWLAEATR